MNRPYVELERAGVIAASGVVRLADLSLSVAEGETLALVGRSGSGKTTALQLVNVLLEPTSGDVRVAGQSTRDWDPIVLRRRTGMVIQEGGLFPHWTVRDNVALVPRLEGWPEERVSDRVDELLELVGLPSELFGGRRPRELSGGQRQRVGFARAFAADPPLLLLDEPFGALDPITRRELQRELALWQRRLGKTVLLVTHDIDEAVRLADRILVLEGGRAIATGSAAELRASEDAAVRAYFGDPPAGGCASPRAPRAGGTAA